MPETRSMTQAIAAARFTRRCARGSRGRGPRLSRTRAPRGPPRHGHARQGRSPTSRGDARPPRLGPRRSRCGGLRQVGWHRRSKGQRRLCGPRAGPQALRRQRPQGRLAQGRVAHRLALVRPQAGAVHLLQPQRGPRAYSCARRVGGIGKQDRRPPKGGLRRPHH